MGVFGLNALLISAISSSLRDWQRRTQRALRQHEAAFDKAGRTIASLAKAEAALKESEARLREQFAQREQFIAMLSHDLRTPLTAAKLAALAARRVRGDEERIAVNSERVVRNIDNADRLIRDLLDASRVGAGQKLPIDPAECDLAAVARSALAELSAVHGERFALHAPAAIQGTWDGNALRRVLENLASNAVKYGEPGTTIDVFLAATDDSVELSVTNRGEPLSADEVQRLFTPYHRSGRAAKSGHAGWGIGLTLVKGVAEAHGGTVSVESSAERGTTFSVRLPREGVLSRSPPPRAP
jgi:signal transduction histidine kinase